MEVRQLACDLKKGSYLLAIRWLNGQQGGALGRVTTHRGLVEDGPQLDARPEPGEHLLAVDHEGGDVALLGEAPGLLEPGGVHEVPQRGVWLQAVRLKAVQDLVVPGWKRGGRKVCRNGITWVIVWTCCMHHGKCHGMFTGVTYALRMQYLCARYCLAWAHAQSLF